MSLGEREIEGATATGYRVERTEVTYRLHNIGRAEPDTVLFTVPADYTRNESPVMTLSASRKDPG